MTLTLTPEIAKNLMYQSMTTGASTAELDKYGGHDAVAAAAASAGLEKNAYWMMNYEKEMGLPQSVSVARNIKEFSPGGAFAAGGALYGDASSFGGPLPGAVNTAGANTTDKQIADLNTKYGLLNTQYGTLNTSYLDLQKQLAALQTKNTGPMSSPTLTTGSGVVSTGATSIKGLNASPGTSSTGAVYGPDGTAYPSPNEAIAAGVYNYTMFPPTGTGQPNGLITNAVSATDAAKLSGVTGNYYGGVNTNPDNPWVNLYPPKK